MPGPKQRRVIAVGGMTLRGSAHDGDGGRHLLTAPGQAHGVVLGQVEVGAKTSEIPMFTARLDRLDTQDAVITADALPAQREHARYLARRGAHYVITRHGKSAIFMRRSISVCISLSTIVDYSKVFA